MDLRPGRDPMPSAPQPPLTANPVNILGISAFYHDSAACLVRDGEIIAAAQEERFTRKKHDAAFPKHAVEFCLRQGAIHARSGLVASRSRSKFTGFAYLSVTRRQDCVHSDGDPRSGAHLDEGPDQELEAAKILPNTMNHICLRLPSLFPKPRF
jgi:hypothetical protein